MPCPICNRPAPPRAENAAAPFCSPRCKQVDLGNWLSDNYRVADSETGDAGDESREAFASERGALDHEEGA